MRNFASVHPRVLLFYYIVICAITMCWNHPVILAISCVGAVLYRASLGKKALRSLRNAGVLLLLLTVTNPLFSHNGKTVLVFLNGKAITAEAFACGFGMGLMVAAVLLWCECFSLTMTSDRYLYLLGGVAPKLSLICSIVMRYIPMLKREAIQVRQIQKALGYGASDRYADRVKGMFSVYSGVVGWSLEQSVETSNAMRARGYELKGKSRYADWHMRSGDWWIFALLLLLCALFGWSAFSNGYAFYYYPVITSAPFSAISVIGLCCVAVLSALPAVIEWEENIKWKYYRFKN